MAGNRKRKRQPPSPSPVPEAAEPQRIIEKKRRRNREAEIEEYYREREDRERLKEENKKSREERRRLRDEQRKDTNLSTKNNQEKVISEPVNEPPNQVAAAPPVKAVSPANEDQMAESSEVVAVTESPSIEAVSPVNPNHSKEQNTNETSQSRGEPVPDDDDAILFEAVAEWLKREAEPKPIEEEPLPNDQCFELDYYNADLNIKAHRWNKWFIVPDNGDAFALVYGGIRSNFGIIVPDEAEKLPRIAFQLQITEYLPMKHIPFEEPEPHAVRIGWSTKSSPVSSLGDEKKSYAFCTLGRKVQNGELSKFGDSSIERNDVLTTILDLEKQEISYYKNGTLLGVAFSEDLFSPGDVIFPHILIKNCKVLVNFGQMNGADKWKLPESDSKTIFVAEINKQFLEPTLRQPKFKSNCTILMMVGLPGVGKTTWTKQYVREHPDENWIIISVDKFMHAISGTNRKKIPHGRMDMVFGLVGKAVNRSITLASRRRHNYIIDQTNLNRDARKKKLAMFEGFHRKCAIICPNEKEAEERQSRRTDAPGKIPVETMLKLKAHMSLPETEAEPIEELLYLEPPLERISEAIDTVKRYNEEGKPWLLAKKPGQKMN